MSNEAHNDANEIITPMEEAKLEVSAAVTSAYNAGSQGANAIARIAVSVLHTLAASNGTVSIGSSTKPVTLSADVLAAYAEGSLPTKAGDASADDPTSSMLIDALATMSPTYTKAIKDRDAHKRASKKGDPITVEQHRAKAERLNTALNTAKQPIRRAMTLAAYIASSVDEVSDGVFEPRYDIGATEVSDGTLLAHYAKPRGDIESVPVTYAHAAEQMKPEDQSQGTRAPQQGTTEGSDDAVAPDTVTMTAESVRKGGPKRDGLAEMIVRFDALLGEMDGAPNPAERDALAHLWSTIGAMLDDQAIVEASEASETAAA